MEATGVDDKNIPANRDRGVTDIILKITYPTADPTHPTMSPVERLGTISEKTPHDPP